MYHTANWRFSAGSKTVKQKYCIAGQNLSHTELDPHTISLISKTSDVSTNQQHSRLNLSFLEDYRPHALRLDHGQIRYCIEDTMVVPAAIHSLLWTWKRPAAGQPCRTWIHTTEKDFPPLPVLWFTWFTVVFQIVTFLDSNFPDKTFPKSSFSQKDDSRMVSLMTVEASFFFRLAECITFKTIFLA